MTSVKKIGEEVLTLVDVEVVRKKLIHLEGFISDLDKYKDLKLENLISDKKLSRFLERTIQLSLEAILDIGRHIISDERLGNPELNSEVIEILAINNIIKDNVDDYIKMAKYQDSLIYDYMGLDSEILLTIIKTNISDLKAIFKWYEDYIS